MRRLLHFFFVQVVAVTFELTGQFANLHVVCPSVLAGNGENDGLFCVYTD